MKRPEVISTRSEYHDGQLIKVKVLAPTRRVEELEPMQTHPNSNEPWQRMRRHELEHWQ